MNPNKETPTLAKPNSVFPVISVRKKMYIALEKNPPHLPFHRHIRLGETKFCDFRAFREKQLSSIKELKKVRS